MAFSQRRAVLRQAKTAWLLCLLLASQIIAASGNRVAGCLEANRANMALTEQIHACAGASWEGHIHLATCSHCAIGWRVCSWKDGEALHELPFPAEPNLGGCYAIDAANDNNTCGPCIDSGRARLFQQEPSTSMAGFGANCQYQTPHEASCLRSGRVDAFRWEQGDAISPGTPQACHSQPRRTTGVLCCYDKENEWTATMKEEVGSAHSQDKGKVPSVGVETEVRPRKPVGCRPGFSEVGSTNWTCITRRRMLITGKRSTVELYCKDDNECRSGEARCHKDAECINTPGSYFCQCMAGFLGDGVMACADLDECAERSHRCQGNSTCRNTHGSYQCKCGGRSIGPGQSCSGMSPVCRRSGQVCFHGGLCDESTKRCRCRPGYEGRHCKRSKCSEKCANGSRCVARNRCRCRPGWAGPSCNKVVCPQGCLNGGTCIKPNVCQCRNRFFGSSCQIRINV